MGACGSKSPALHDDHGPPQLPGIIKPIEMAKTGSTFDDNIESNILEPEEIEDIFIAGEENEEEPNKTLPSAPRPKILESPKRVNTARTASPLLPLPGTTNPSKIVTTPAVVIHQSTDKDLNAFKNPTPPSSMKSMTLGDGLAKLAVPVQSPRNTKKVSAQEFFSDDLKSMDFDLFDSPSSHSPSAISLGSIQEIALKDADAPTNKLQRSRASIHTTSTSSYEEIVIESDDDYEVESTVYEVASNGSYVEEVIDDQVYEAFVKAQQESHGKLTFDEFLHQQQQEEEKTENTTSSPAVVEPPILSKVESGIDNDPASRSKGESGIDNAPAILSKAEIETNDDPPRVEVKTTKIEPPTPLKVTTDDHSAIVTELTVQTEQETPKPVSETTSMRPLSILIEPQTPLSNKPKPNSGFVGMELCVADMLGESTNVADRFLVSPMASPPQHVKKRTLAEVPFSPLSQKGLEGKSKRKSTSVKESKTKDSKKKSKRHSDVANEKQNEGEREKKSPRRISRQSKSGDEHDKSKDHRKHHRRKEESTESITKGKDSSRSLDKEKKRKSSSSKKHDDGTSSRRSSITSSKKRSKDPKRISSEKRREDVTKKEPASPQSTQSTRSNPIVLTNKKDKEKEATDAHSTPMNRRASRKIKFQPRRSIREDETILVDHKSVESDRSDFVKKMEALRARLDEAVGGSASDLPTKSIPETPKSNRSEETPRGKHKIRRKKNQDEKENLGDEPAVNDARKGKSKQPSSRKRASAQNAKTSSCVSTARGKV